MAKKAAVTALPGIATVLAKVPTETIYGSVAVAEGAIHITAKAPRSSKMETRVIPFTKVASYLEASSEDGGYVVCRVDATEVDSPVAADVNALVVDENGFIAVENEDGVVTMVNAMSADFTVSIVSERFDAEGTAPAKGKAKPAKEEAAPAKGKGKGKPKPKAEEEAEEDEWDEE